MRSLVTAAALSALVLGAGAAPGAEPVRIGFIATLSGPGGALGQDMLDGFRLGIDQAGGTLGGREIELLAEDDQLKPEVGLQIANRMIERDQVDIITGIVFSNVMMAVAKPVADAGVILLSQNAGPSPLAGEQCLANFFSTSWQNDQSHEAMGKYLQDQGVKRLYVMAPNYQAGWDSIAGVRRYFQGEIVGEVYTRIGQPDYSAELAALRAAAPEATFVFYPGGMGINFVKQYAQAGLKDVAPLYTAFTTDELTLEAQGEAALGVFASSFWTPSLDNETNRAFVEAFEIAYERIPSPYAAQGYDAARLLDAALRTLPEGEVDDAALREALLSAEFDSVRGDFTFNVNHFPIQDFYIRKVVDEEGGLGFDTVAKAFDDHKDAYYEACELQ
ncbi:MAG TPA: ABC transporter substrate-binding protein [Geminicoccaceae bacterium]